MLIETKKLRELLAVNKEFGREEARLYQERFEKALHVVECVAYNTGLEEDRAPVVIVYKEESILSREEIEAAHRFAG
ncbi:MAG: hypothetical protein PHF86_04870 [Candidatus Nanoarchaeia archaeon]|jgi:hypothetical protein|nr:hypothetical protein [Candidatus Nanoarchaeia archaeon]